MKRNVLPALSLAILILQSCGQKDQKTVAPSLQVDGNYVSDAYAQRNEGYDWVSVSVKTEADSGLDISVRSRGDLKKPSCTFDAKAKKSNDSLYLSNFEGNEIQFKFKTGSLEIDAANSNILRFFCSGGGSIGGVYQKINEPLDASQMEKSSPDSAQTKP